MTRIKKITLRDHLRDQARLHRLEANPDSFAKAQLAHPKTWNDSTFAHYADISEHCAQQNDYLADLIDADLAKERKAVTS